jgi:anion-transporting  ArsA/GET3 family ATPase
MDRGALGGLTPTWVGNASVTIVAGKGGVGSSTVAAALAIVAARQGADVLLIAVDGRPGLGPLLGGGPIGPEEIVLRAFGRKGRIRGRTVPPEQAFSDYLALKGIGGLLRKAASAASLDVIAAATPGLEHLLVLGKIKELDRERTADLIIVDAPPAGLAAPFLRSASALQAVVASGPIRTQADEVAEMLADRKRCQGLLVSIPEETPINEVVELAYDVEERLGLALGPLVINACWPDLAGLQMSASDAARAQGVKLSRAAKIGLDVSAEFGRHRMDGQRRQLARLDELLPLARIILPRVPTARFGPAELDLLADALSVDPTVAS